MDSNPSSYQRGSSRVTSFDPSAPSPTVEGTKNSKEYGSGFSSGFLRYLDSGELWDVAVDVITEDADELAGPSLSACPEAPSNGAAPDGSGAFVSPPRYQGVAPSGASSSSSSSSVLPAKPAITSQQPPCHSHRLHGLLLARHSAFFAAALGQEHFADSAARRIRLTLDRAAAPEWPTLVRYFYTDKVRLDDSNALPLLALARQLLVPELDAFCTDYVRGRLCATNCIPHLRAAVRFALHDLHAECVALAAQGFPVLYGDDLSGLPPSSLLEILTHPLLQIHCELQVVEAITRYLATTAVDADAVRALCAQIRFPYLDNATITRLAAQPSALLLGSANVTGVTATAGAAVAVAEARSPSGSDAEERATAGAGAAADGSAPTQTPGPESGGCTTAVQPASGPFRPAADAPAAASALGGSDSAPSSAAEGTNPSSAERRAGTRPNLESGSEGPGASSGPPATAGAMPTAPTGGGGAAVGSDGAAAVPNADGGARLSPTGGDGLYGSGGGGSVDDDSGLLTASDSALSSPGTSGGGAGPTRGSCVGQQDHHGLPPSAGCRSGQQPGAAAPLRQQQQQQHNIHPQQGGHLNGHHQLQQQQQQQQQQCPLVPRDLALEGALARLAAMEFHASLGQSFAGPGGCSPSDASSSSAAANGGAGLGLHHPYVQHPYLHTAAAAANGPAAAALLGPAAGGVGRRQLAVFRVFPGPQPALPYVGVQAQVPYFGNADHHLAPGAAGLQHQQHQANPVHPAAESRGGDGSHAAAAAAAAAEAGSFQGAVGGSGGEGGRRWAAGDGSSATAHDAATALAGCFLPPPRPSYCCNVVHGLPGGCAWVDVALEVLWEHLVPYITVKVSGCGEGRPHAVVATEPDCFFETNDSSESLPWIEIQMPHNVNVLHLHRYTFLHGHRRAGYYRARNFKTQIAVRPADELRTPSSNGAAAAAVTAAGPTVAVATAAGAVAGAPVGAAAAGPPGAGPAPAGAQEGLAQRQAQGQGQVQGPATAAPAPATRYFDLATRMADQFDVGILAGASAVGPWRVLRLQATGAQEDGVHRLCVRGLRMYGIARVDLMRQSNGFVVQPHWVINARIEHGGGGSGGGGSSHGGGGGGGPGCGNGGGVMPSWSTWHGP